MFEDVAICVIIEIDDKAGFRLGSYGLDVQCSGVSVKEGGGSRYAQEMDNSIRGQVRGQGEKEEPTQVRGCPDLKVLQGIKRAVGYDIIRMEPGRLKKGNNSLSPVFALLHRPLRIGFGTEQECFSSVSSKREAKDIGGRPKPLNIFKEKQS